MLNLNFLSREPPCTRVIRKLVRRPKQRGLRARQKNDPVREIRVALVERENRKQHRRNFKQLRPDRHAAFAVTISQVPAGHRKQQKWNCEKISDQEHAKIFFRRGGIAAENQENYKKFQAIIIEGALELRPDQAPKTTPPLPRSGRHIFRRILGHGPPSPGAGKLGCSKFVLWMPES